ncbi:hypothetical protein BT63DRAFT_372002 [Microthyrium microscopicum]|uniref:SPRY domain-containing protein n=1 Tax=Microthyrium microscopicum TaxID=703497 RepID=A0A6A6UGX5_9PEZI|nr:hypothetical protein BT63DRAFT_372002 [Microthyrium microscopicum]
MADSHPSPGGTPTAIRRLDEDHAPPVPSPLNPDQSRSRAIPKPVAREQREKKDSLKKRESVAGARGATPDVKQNFKAPPASGPKRVVLPAPEPQAYLAPRDSIFAPHEPEPIYTPDGSAQLKRPVDINYNNKNTRTAYCVADPLFPHMQLYRQTEVTPFTPHMSVHDSDRNIHFDSSCRTITNVKGWRMARANVFAREGSLYYEVKVVRGIPESSQIGFQETEVQPHVRMGWTRREAPLDAPVGFDGYSYGVTDTRFDTMHRSRVGKFLAPKTKNKAKPKTPQTANPDAPMEPIRTGDVIGMMITLPPLNLHRKVVAGTYNPAVDLYSSTPDPDAPPPDIIRDRAPIISRHTYYLEHSEYQPTKIIKAYGDRAPVNAHRPYFNHEEIPLRSLPHSNIKVYKNGELVGTAFENLLAFLPPASMPTGEHGVRQGFDDGSLGYYPAISVFSGGIAEANFGPDFWYPPPDLQTQSQDVEMGNIEPQFPSSSDDAPKPRAISERYAEQIAEDVVWDIIDEAGFFAQDGGYR